MVRRLSLNALLVWSTRDHLYYPLLGGEFLVSTNFPLWGLSEAKRLSVIALPLWDPQRRRSFLCGSELQKSCVSFACLSSLHFSNPRTCFCPIYLLVVFQLIYAVAGGSQLLNLTLDSSIIARIVSHFKFCFRNLCSVGSTDPVPEVPSPLGSSGTARVVPTIVLTPCICFRNLK
jgi:hypothetical protein